MVGEDEPAENTVLQTIIKEIEGKPGDHGARNSKEESTLKRKNWLSMLNAEI